MTAPAEHVDGPVDPAAVLLEVQDLKIWGAEGQPLVTGATFNVREGEAIAIVGESGSGKSLTARSVIGLLPQGLESEGVVRYRGTNLLGLSQKERAKLRGSEICMVLQDPFTMLHPMLRCGAVITENMRTEAGKKLSKAARRAEAVRRLAEVGIHDERVVDRFPFELSGGMRQRVAIAAALAQDPRLLIADEPSTALDASTQKEVLDLLLKLQQSRGMALILITHDLRVAFSVCQQVNVFYAGEILERGPASAVALQPLHPYTLGLLLAEPPLDRRVQDFVSIPGSVPTPDRVVSMCAFAPRCEWATDRCHHAKPELLQVGSSARSAACHRVADIHQLLAQRQASFEHSDAPIPASINEAGLLSIRDLAITFGKLGKPGAVEAVKSVSLDVFAGESVGIVGESGSGKTTLSRSVIGLVEPSGGTITLDGLDASSYKKASTDQRRQLRRKVQIVFQDPYSSLNPAHTIGSALEEALKFGRNDTRGHKAVEELLERVGLPARYRTRLPVALSGGERQRIAIARAIAVEPRLLICDEPVSALDVSVQAQILDLLRNIREETGIAYLFITHDLAVVRQVADRIYVMNRGEVVEQGPTDDVLDRPQHSYTQQLVSANFGAHGHSEENVQ
jgi:peptide/nickel transport system ATP-binding protein